MTVWSKDPQIFEITKYTGDVLTDAVLDMYLQTRKMS